MLFQRISALAAVAAGLWIALPVRAAQPGAVVINELLWMGSSVNSADEWIELRNTTAQPVDLSNWTIFKKSGNETVPMLTLPAGASITANNFFLIVNFPETDARSTLAVTPDFVDASVSLVNSALQVTLADAVGQTIDVADDGSGTPLAGKYVSGQTWHSMERNRAPGDGTQRSSWHTASSAVNLKPGPELGTPKAANSNLPPSAPTLSAWTASVGEVITFDASEATDPEGDALTFLWSFGDGAVGSGATPTHAYTAAGTFLVELNISDGEATTRAQGKAVVAAAAPTPTASPRAPTPTSAPSAAPSTIAPSATAAPAPIPAAAKAPPVTAPTPSVRPAKGLKLNELFIDPEGRDAGVEFVEIRNATAVPLATSDWRIAIRDRTAPLPLATLAPGALLVLQSETLPLFLRNAGGEVRLLDPTGAVRDGVRYPKARTGQAFARTAKRWAWTTPTPGTANVVEPAASSAESVDGPRSVSIQEAREADPSDSLSIVGIVVVAPGVLGDRQLLLADDTSAIVVTLAQAGQYEAGARLTIIGQRTTAKEPRLRATAVRAAGRTEPPSPLGTEIAALSSDDLGTLVALEGTVMLVRSSSFTLDDETGTVSVSGQAARDAERGARVRVTGVVRASGGRVRLTAVRVESLAAAPATKPAETPKPRVAAATVEAPAATPIQPGPTAPRLGYVLIGLAGVLVVLRQALASRLA